MCPDVLAEQLDATGNRESWGLQVHKALLVQLRGVVNRNKVVDQTNI
jgi:hypothetical protein